jgi:hypothetical protein
VKRIPLPKTGANQILALLSHVPSGPTFWESVGNITLLAFEENPSWEDGAKDMCSAETKGWLPVLKKPWV